MEKMIKDNVIIGWCSGRAVILDEEDKIWYCEMPAEYTVPGEVIDSDELHSIDELPEDEAAMIMEYVKLMED